MWFLILVAARHHCSLRLLSGILTMALLHREPSLAGGDSWWELANATLAACAILAHLSYSELVFNQSPLMTRVSFPLMMVRVQITRRMVILMHLRTLLNHRSWLNFVKRPSYWVSTSSLHLWMRFKIIVLRLLLEIIGSSLVNFPLFEYWSRRLIVAYVIKILRDINILLL